MVATGVSSIVSSMKFAVKFDKHIYTLKGNFFYLNDPIAFPLAPPLGHSLQFQPYLQPVKL